MVTCIYINAEYVYYRILRRIFGRNTILLYWRYSVTNIFDKVGKRWLA